MFRKLLILTTLVCFSLVQANAATHNSLKHAFDDLSYALSVEWDQQDRQFYNQQMEKFAHQLKNLQAAGLTNQELIEFTSSQVKNQRMAQDLKKALEVVSFSKMTAEEAHKYVTNVMNDSYSRGASWAGEVIGGVIAVIVFVAIAAIIAGKAKIEDGCYKVYTCERDCFGSVCAEECNYRCL